MGGGLVPAVFCSVVEVFFLPQEEMRKIDNKRNVVTESLMVVDG
jgi:hypothetical protein